MWHYFAASICKTYEALVPWFYFLQSAISEVLVNYYLLRSMVPIDYLEFNHVNPPPLIAKFVCYIKFEREK
jgi:hypothetical protein